MDIYEAAFMRKSVRKYIMEELEPEKLNNIMNFALHLENLQEGQSVQFQILNSAYDKKKLRKSLSVEAPYYFLISTKEDRSNLINAGYLMEQISLYLTTKGLGSCFAGSRRLTENGVAQTQYSFYMLLAFGKTRESICRDPRLAKRQDEECLSIFKEDTNEDMKTIIKAARLAPSSYNSQPWRFVIYQNRIHVFCKRDWAYGRRKQKLYMFNIGIMLAHMAIAAEQLWLTITIKKIDNLADRYYKNNDYVVSVLVKESLNYQ